jgi:hypothetical protein
MCKHRYSVYKKEFLEENSIAFLPLVLEDVKIYRDALNFQRVFVLLAINFQLSTTFKSEDVPVKNVSYTFTSGLYF